MARTSLLAILTVLGIVVGSGDVPAQTVSDQYRTQLEKIVATPGSANKLLALTTEAAKLRQLIANDAVGAAKNPSPEIRSFVEVLNREPLSQKFPVVWSLFFRSAIVYPAAINQDEPIVGFYNPLVDSWIVSQWKRDPKTATFYALSDRVAILPNELLTAKKSKVKGIPSWVEGLRKDTIINVLPQSSKAAGNTFVRAFPLETRTPIQLPAARSGSEDVHIVEQRLFWSFQNVARVRSDRVLADFSDTIKKSIVTGDILSAKKLFRGATKMPIEEVMKMPREVRSRIEVAFSLYSDDGVIFIFSSPYDSSWYFPAIVDLKNGKPNLIALGVMDLADAR